MKAISEEVSYMGMGSGMKSFSAPRGMFLSHGMRSEIPPKMGVGNLAKGVNRMGLLKSYIGRAKCPALWVMSHCPS